MKLRKKLFAGFMALMMALSCAACGNKESASETAEREPEPAATEPGATDNAEDAALNGDSASVNGLIMTVDRSTGEMDITRPVLRGAGHAMGDAETWTIFLYLCGTDLETEAGMATDDLNELLAASASGNIRFVIETGGAYRWNNTLVSSRSQTRFVAENGNLNQVDSFSRSGMGRSETLASFLQWGVANYPAEHMGVILWNHGGGSITGVCFDELDSYDSLSLREMDAALLSVYEGMSDKFEFIGFDACLMASIETANIAASYADYLIASEETEPGSGWDYTAIGNYLAAHPSADGAELGRVICDSYYSACEAEDCEYDATISVIDLSLLDELLISFTSFAENLYKADDSVLSEIVRAIEGADNFGGNNRIEGYTNMVDLGGVIRAAAPYADGGEAALAALDDAVVYSVNGYAHSGASGLSIYYPLQVQGSEELSIFGDICVSPFYLSFVDRQNHGSVNEGNTAGYSDDYWYNDSGLWQWFGNYLYDNTSNSYSYDQAGESYDSYWQYADEFEQTGNSSLITFAVEPHLDDEGDFWFLLDDDGWYYAADVLGYVYQISEDGEDLIELGETYDIIADWDSGFFCDDFDGYWLSLPDGQNLATYIVDVTDEYIIYTSPILLNDEEMYLRMRQYDDGSVTIDGAWDGIGDSGAASRELVRLQDGDVIVPLYYSYLGEDMEDGYYYGWEYTVRGVPRINYQVMEDGDYYFSFCIDDIYGDYCMTDSAMFNVENGEVYYYED